MVRLNVIESRVPPVIATAKESLVIFMMAVGATSILAAIIFFLMYIFTHGIGLM